MNSNKRNTWELTPFGKKVKKKLIEKGMTTAELADGIGTSRSYLSQVLYGKKGDSEYITVIAIFLDIKNKEYLKKAVGE
ncbi:MAG: helix-turn-helix domain-containing protein [Anaerotignaceae bacterium]